MKAVFIVFLTFSLVSQCSAQDSTTNSLTRSTFALQFQIGNNFTLESFQGSTLSFKYHILDESALRAGFSLSSNVDTYRKENGIEKNGSKSFSITFNAQFIQYLETIEDVSLYTGGGPQYSRRLYKSDDSEINSNYWLLGLSGVLGVEWFFRKNMSLSAEYGIVIYYMVENGSNLSNESSTVKSLNTGDFNMLKFGISIYI